ncbi:LuxR C-terminal-related transcriptional regulator [Sphingomicrobium aestuariivivum]|nr:LuxR C-terminal-related transcriptional regulator [Sphingomicrobium aestuariivivum]
MALESIEVPDDIRCLAEYSPIPAVISNPRLPDNPLVVINDKFLGMTGYALDEILGRNCRFLAGPKTEPFLTDKIRSAIDHRKPVLVEILNYKKDGTPFRNAVLIAPIFSDDGELQWFLGSQVELGEEELGPSPARAARAVEMVKTLSPRQAEVMKLVASGLRNKQIAYELGLSEKTIKMHRGLVMEKLGLRTSAEMVRIAVEAGI